MFALQCMFFSFFYNTCSNFVKFSCVYMDIAYTQIQMRKCTYSLTYLHTYAGCTCVYHLLFSPSLHGQLLAEKFNLSAVDVSQYAVYDHRDNGG